MLRCALTAKRHKGSQGGNEWQNTLFFTLASVFLYFLTSVAFIVMALIDAANCSRNANAATPSDAGVAGTGVRIQPLSNQNTTKLTV